MPIVVLSAGYCGLSVARSLGRLGVAVYGVHCGPHLAVSRSRYWRRNSVADFAEPSWDRLADWLMAEGEAIGARPVLLPTDDRGALFVDAYADRLLGAFRFPVSPPGLLRALSDKARLYELCRAHGMPTPETLRPRGRGDVTEFARRARFPMVLKGIDTQRFLRTVGARVVRCRDADELLRGYDAAETPDAPNVVVQEYVPSDGADTWIYHGYFGSDSACLFAMTGRKIREHPVSGGVTTFGVSAANGALVEQSARFVAAVGLHGIVDLDYKRDARTGEYNLLDVNPRVGSNFRLSVGARGVDVVQALYRDVTSQPVLPTEARDGRRWMVEDLDLVSSLGGGARGARGWLSALRRVEEGVWFAADDLGPALARGPELAAVALSRRRTPADRA